MTKINPAGSSYSEEGALSYIFSQLLAGCFFCEIVRVKATRGEAPNLVVDVIPLQAFPDENGHLVQPSTVFNIPVWRLQRGNSAIIMNPVPGDIGYLAVCGRDSTRVRASQKTDLPATRRRHNLADGIYIGGLLNQPPTQFVEFSDNAINITSPGNVVVNCQSASVTAPGGVKIDTPVAHFTGNITADGNITDNAGEQNTSLKSLRDAYNAHHHSVEGVQTGGSTITSDTPDNPS